MHMIGVAGEQGGIIYIIYIYFDSKCAHRTRGFRLGQATLYEVLGGGRRRRGEGG